MDIDRQRHNRKTVIKVLHQYISTVDKIGGAASANYANILCPTRTCRHLVPFEIRLFLNKIIGNRPRLRLSNNNHRIAKPSGLD